jgi:hypothetical protein
MLGKQKKCFVYGILDLLFLEGDSITVWHVEKSLKSLSLTNDCSAKIALNHLQYKIE